MKLLLSRSQEDRKGVFGGHKGVSFELYYYLELTDEEDELVQRYRLGEYVVTEGESGRGGQVLLPRLTIQDLLKGHRSTVGDVRQLLLEENAVKDGCDDVLILFNVCRSFGGEEVVDYPRKEAEA